MALQRTVLSIPISEGLDTKTDDKQVLAGKALVLENARFQKTGKLSKRFGLTAVGSSPGTCIHLASDAKNLNAITEMGVVNYSPTENTWYTTSPFSVGAKIESEMVDQAVTSEFRADCDSDPLGNYIGYVGLDSTSGQINVILEEVATGSKKKSAITGLVQVQNTARCFISLVRDAGALKVAVLYCDDATVTVKIYDSNLSALTTTNLISPVTDYFVQIHMAKTATNLFICHHSNITGTYYKLNFAGSIVSSTTKTISQITAGAPIIPWGISTNIYNSVWYVSYVDRNRLINLFAINTTTLATLATSSIVGSVATILGICQDPLGAGIIVASSRDSGTYDTRFTQVYYCNFNGSSFSNSSYFNPKLMRLLVLSCPFVYNNEIYLPVSTGEDKNLSGYLLKVKTSEYHLTNIFSPAQIAVGETAVSKTIAIGNSYYTAVRRVYRSASDESLGITGVSKIRFEFGSNTDTGGRVKVGESIYYSNGPLIEIDTLRPHENNFFLCPNIISVLANTGVTNANVASKKFSYLAVYEYLDGSGQITRSAISFPNNLPTTPATTESISIRVAIPVATLKFINGKLARPNIVVYRTINNGSIFYRLIEKPADFNDGSSITFTDTYSDASIQDNETIYTTGEVLENAPAPTARFLTSGGNRLFLGGLEVKDEIAFSKKQKANESVAFSDFFRIRVSTGSNADKTPISGLGYMDGKLIIFRQRSIMYVAGDGPLDTGINDTFTEPESIQSDVGCVDPRSVISMPLGIMFKSQKGIYLLNRSLQVTYKGAPVEDFNTQKVIASTMSDKFNEVRFYTDANVCLVYNYLFDTWSSFTNQTTVDADNWQNMPVLLKSNVAYKEVENLYKDNNAYYSMKFTSPWLKLDLVQGYARAYQLWIIGSFKSAHTLRCRVYTDYDLSTYEDYSLIYSNTDSPQYQFQISLPHQKVQSIMFEIFDDSQSGTGESYDLSNIQVEVGLKAGGYKLAASKSY